MARGIKPQESGGNQNNFPPLGSENGRIYRTGAALNTLAIPSPFSETPDIETVEHDGEVVFQYFVTGTVPRPVLQTIGIDTESNLEEQPEVPETAEAVDQGFAQAEVPAAGFGVPMGYHTTVSGAVGRRLKELADQFSRSIENQLVHEEANRVNLNDINEESFQEMLRVLFFEGISIERLIALFYFCSYVLTRAFQETKGELCKQMFFWSLQFIKTHVCRWVHANGGWGKVLGKMYDVAFKVLTLCAVVVVIAASVSYIMRK